MNISQARTQRYILLIFVRDLGWVCVQTLRLLAFCLPLTVEAPAVYLHLCWYQSLIDLEPQHLIALPKFKLIHSNVQITVSHRSSWRLLKATSFQQVLSQAVVVAHVSKRILCTLWKDHLCDHDRRKQVVFQHQVWHDLHFFFRLAWKHLNFLCCVEQIERQGLQTICALLFAEFYCWKHGGMVYDTPDDRYLDEHGLSWLMTWLIFILVDLWLLVLLELNLYLDRSGNELCSDRIEVDMPDFQCRKVTLICLQLLSACVVVLRILLAFIYGQVSRWLQEVKIKIWLVKWQIVIIDLCNLVQIYSRSEFHLQRLLVQLHQSKVHQTWARLKNRVDRAYIERNPYEVTGRKPNDNDRFLNIGLNIRLVQNIAESSIRIRLDNEVDLIFAGFLGRVRSLLVHRFKIGFELLVCDIEFLNIYLFLVRIGHCESMIDLVSVLDSIIVDRGQAKLVWMHSGVVAWYQYSLVDQEIEESFEVAIMFSCCNDLNLDWLWRPQSDWESLSIVQECWNFWRAAQHISDDYISYISLPLGFGIRYYDHIHFRGQQVYRLCLIEYLWWNVNIASEKPRVSILDGQVQYVPGYDSLSQSLYVIWFFICKE